MENETRILQAWQQNAVPWIATIENEDIPSRPQATNQAVVQAVWATQPERVLDVGCGEGWLVRKLANQGLSVVGVDGVEGLIQYAKEKGNGHFLCLSYEELIAGENDALGQFDTLVFNFSLFGKTTTHDLLHRLRDNLVTGGQVVIQTLHPQHELFKAKDGSGWVKEEWKGMPQAFEQAFHWFFRDEEDWKKLFADTGYRLRSQQAVPNPFTGGALAVIFTLEKI